MVYLCMCNGPNQFVRKKCGVKCKTTLRPSPRKNVQRNCYNFENNDSPLFSTIALNRNSKSIDEDQNCKESIDNHSLTGETNLIMEFINEVSFGRCGLIHQSTIIIDSGWVVAAEFRFSYVFNFSFKKCTNESSLVKHSYIAYPKANNKKNPVVLLQRLHSNGPWKYVSHQDIELACGQWCILSTSNYNKKTLFEISTQVDHKSLDDIFYSEHKHECAKEYIKETNYITMESEDINDIECDFDAVICRQLLELEHFMPSLEHVRLFRMMIKHVHHFVNTALQDIIIPSPYQTHPMSPLDEFKRSIIPNMLQKSMYSFLRHSFDRWPLDNSFRMVLETWLTYIQPWRYTSKLPSTRRDSEGDTKLVEEKWFTFIEDNLLFYSVLLQEIFNRVKRMDLMNLANNHMLYRVAKVFRLENLDSMLRQAEQEMCTSIYRSSGHMTRDLGGSYLSPESSLMFHSQISDLEKPGFQYTLMFGEKTLYSVLRTTCPGKSTEKTTAEKKTFKNRYVHDHHMLMKELFKAFKEQKNRKVFWNLPKLKVCIETDKNYHEELVFFITHSAAILLPNYLQEKIETVKHTWHSKSCEECIDHIIKRYSLQQEEFAYPLVLNGLISNMEQRNYLNAMNTLHLLLWKHDYIIIIEVAPRQSNEWNVTVIDRDKTATTFQSQNTSEVYNIGIEALCSSVLYLSSCFRSFNEDRVSQMINLKLDKLSLYETDKILLKVNRNDRECLNVQVYNDILHYCSRHTKLIHCCDYVGLLMVIVQQVKELRSVTYLSVKLCDCLVLQTESDWWRFKPVANEDFDLWELLFAVCHPKQQIVCADGSCMKEDTAQMDHKLVCYLVELLQYGGRTNTQILHGLKEYDDIQVLFSDISNFYEQKLKEGFETDQGGKEESNAKPSKNGKKYLGETYLNPSERMDRNLFQDLNTIPDDEYTDLGQDLSALHTEKLELEQILAGDYDNIQFMNGPRIFDAKDDNYAMETDSLLSNSTESLFTSSCSGDSSLVSTNGSIDENCNEFPFPESSLTNYASTCETSYQDIHAEKANNCKEDKKLSLVFENVENIILTNQGNEFRVDSGKLSDHSQKETNLDVSKAKSILDPIENVFCPINTKIFHVNQLPMTEDILEIKDVQVNFKKIFHCTSACIDFPESCIERYIHDIYLYFHGKDNHWKSSQEQDMSVSQYKLESSFHYRELEPRQKGNVVPTFDTQCNSLDSSEINVYQTESSFETNVNETENSFETNVNETENSFEIHVNQTENSFEIHVNQTESSFEINEKEIRLGHTKLYCSLDIEEFVYFLKHENEIADTSEAKKQLKHFLVAFNVKTIQESRQVGRSKRKRMYKRARRQTLSNLMKHFFQYFDENFCYKTLSASKKKTLNQIFKYLPVRWNSEFVVCPIDGLKQYFEQMSVPVSARPAHAETMKFEWVRVRSFWSFPSNIRVSPIAMARVGFYYTGKCAECRCFCCGKVYREWRDGDDPYLIHQQISPTCFYLNGRESGNVPIHEEDRLKPRHLVEQTLYSANAPADNAQAGALPGLNHSELSQIPVPQIPNTQERPFGSSQSGDFTFRPPESTQSGPASQQPVINPPLPGYFSQTQQTSQNANPTTPASLPSVQQGSTPVQNASSTPQGSGLSSQQNQPETQPSVTVGEQSREVSRQPSVGSGTIAGSQESATTTVSTAPSIQPQATAATTSGNKSTTSSSTSHAPPATTTTSTTSTTGGSSSSTAVTEPSRSRFDPLGINFEKPRYPAYAVLTVRINTYNGWPNYLDQTPRVMATAGFFYAGYGDYTRCFFCGGGLRNWEAGDDPWVEHARWFPKCAFLRQNKGDNYVRMVQTRHQEAEASNQPIQLPRQLSVLDEGRPANIMSSIPVQTLREMGKDDTIINQAIDRWRSNRQQTGRSHDNAELQATEIYEVILQIEEEREQGASALPTTGQQLALTQPMNQVVPQTSVAIAEETTEQPTGAEGTTDDLSYMEGFEKVLEEYEEQKEKLTCTICMENPVAIAFLPCGHLVCCLDCAPAMRKCPICNELVKGTIKTFFP